MLNDVLLFYAFFSHSSVPLSGGSEAAILYQRSLQTTTVTQTYLYLGRLG